jgi:hypothetical protein
VYKIAWNTNIPFSMIALKDLAAVSRTVLYERECHFYTQYPLVSAHAPITFGEAIDVIGKKLGKIVKIEKLQYKQAVDGFLVRLSGTDESVRQRSRDAAQRMILFYDHRELVGNSNVLEWVLRRNGTHFGEWVEGVLRVQS